MNRLLAENATSGKFEIVSSTAGALNTTDAGGGGDGNSIMKALTDIADPNTAIFLKTETNGSLNVNDSKISVGNQPTSAGATMQQVLLYGKKTDNTLQPLETSGDRLLVDVLELAASGPISTSSALSAIQVCGKGADNLFKTLSCDNSGVLNVAQSAVAPIDGSTSLPAVQIGGYDSSGLDFKAIQVNNNRSLEVADEKITQGEGTITGGGSGLQQVLFYGKDQSGNLDPINVDSNGHLKVTLNDIEPNITSAIKTEIFGLDGSTQRQVAVDSSGRLTTNTIYLIQRGTITFPAPFTSGGVSSSIDVSDKTTFDFHIEGMTNTHTGFIVQASNDNTNFYSIEMFMPQTVGLTTYIGGSVTRGFRYYRIENAGTSVSVTASPFNSYNN